MEEHAATWVSNAHRKKDLRWRKRQQIKHDIYFMFFKLFWRFLHLSGLAIPYSKTMCHFGLYRKFPDGRCQWCGDIHK